MEQNQDVMKSLIFVFKWGRNIEPSKLTFKKSTPISLEGSKLGSKMHACMFMSGNTTRNLALIITSKLYPFSSRFRELIFSQTEMTILALKLNT